MWGKVFYRQDNKLWGVRGSFEGVQYKFYYIPSDRQIPCRHEENAIMLQAIITDDISNNRFNPRRYWKNSTFTLKGIFKEYVDQRKEFAKQEDITWSTYDNDFYAFQKICSLSEGKSLIHQITNKSYSDIWLKLGDIDKSTRKGYLRTLFQVMKYAVSAKYIFMAPEQIKFEGKFKVKKKVPYYLSIFEQVTVIKAINPIHRPFFQFLMITGIRPSEGRALSKKDLYPKKGIIKIRNTFKKGPKGKEIIGPVKQQEERSILYPEELQRLIEALPENESDFVFINQNTGKPYTRTIEEIWKKAVKDSIGGYCAIKNATRHSYGNHLEERGLTSKEIALILGHFDDRTTNAYYLTKKVMATAQKGHEKMIDLNEAIITGDVSGLSQG